MTAKQMKDLERLHKAARENAIRVVNQAAAGTLTDRPALTLARTAILLEEARADLEFARKTRKQIEACREILDDHDSCLDGGSHES